MREELNNKKNIVKLVGEPYIWDIHQSKPYKELYNLRKEKVAQLSTLIAVGKNKENKIAITKLNKELLQLKNKMEEITKLNSIMKLEIKMQVAFGFLISNFGKNYSKKNKEKKLEKYRKIDLDLFLGKNGFESSDFDKIDLYRKDKEIYLKSSKNSFEGIDKIDFNFGQLESRVEPLESFLSNKKENNLSKFYILMYLLLPVEMRGDLLGFVKKHYYDIKNIDFVEIEGKTKDKIKVNMEENQDKFFHNLRMFEKNSKKFEIINYGIIDFNQLRSDFDKIYEKFGLNVEKLNFLEQKVEGESKIFDKNIILPIMKYYQHIFKLLNDIEIHALFKYSDEKSLHFNNSVQLLLEKNHLNYSFLLNKSGAKKVRFDLRNRIAHLNYKELISAYLNGINNVNKNIEDILDEIIRVGLDKELLDTNFINDFYQRKEQFIYNQKQINVVEVTDSKREEKFDKEKRLLEVYNLKSSNLDSILKKYLELVVIDENTPIINNKKMKFLSEVEVILPKTNNNKEKLRKKIKEIEWFEEEEYKNNILGKLNRDSSDLLGIYKKYIIKNLKTKLINLFIKGEKRYIHLDLYNKSLFDEKVRDVGKIEAREYFNQNNLNSSKENIIKIAFNESCDKSWNDTKFKPKFEMGESQDLLDKKGINGKVTFDSQSHIFSYESLYKNPKKKVHRRNILTGIVEDEKKDKRKGNNFGLYIQKIKGLY